MEQATMRKTSTIGRSVMMSLAGLVFALPTSADTLPLKALPDDERYFWWYHQVQTD